MTLGSRIQLLRKQKSLSQEEFANSMGVTRQSVSKWELDQSYPAIDKLIEIANFFHISLDEMLEIDASISGKSLKYEQGNVQNFNIENENHKWNENAWYFICWGIAVIIILILFGMKEYFAGFIISQILVWTTVIIRVYGIVSRNKDNPEIAKRLIKFRQLHKWSQNDLAIKLKTTRKVISKWETGQSQPNIEMLLLLSKLYKISINDLLETKQGFKISNFEELATVDINKVKVALSNVDKKQIIMASLGASPTTNDFLERIFPDIDFPKMREVIGRISIEEVEKAEQEIVKIMNEYEANK